MASHNVPRLATNVERTDEQRTKEAADISSYRALVDNVHDKELLKTTTALLSKNPEYYTIWNVRRRILISVHFSAPPEAPVSHRLPPIDTLKPSSQAPRPDCGPILDVIKSDLSFVMPLLKAWPKCYWIWNYRIWLLQQAISHLSIATARALWSSELAIVTHMLTRDSRNFHGWSYRRLVVETLEDSALDGQSLAESEFEYTTLMIRQNLSNFSAWHARSILIPRVLNERALGSLQRWEFLEAEFETLKQALWTDCEDQSIWFYWRYLMLNLTDSQLMNADGCSRGIAPQADHGQRTSALEAQLAELRELLDGAEDCKWIYEALLEYTLELARMEVRPLTEKEEINRTDWLAQLRTLDPLRKGRWESLSRVS